MTSKAGRSTPATTPRTTAQSAPAVTVEAFDDAIPSFIDEWDVPGASVAVLNGDRLVYADAYGVADRESDAQVAPGSLFRVGSLSKPITAVTVLKLVEAGDLSLDDWALDYLDDVVPDGGPADDRATEITVRHLLRHVAGLDKSEMGARDPAFAPVQVAEAWSGPARRRRDDRAVRARPTARRRPW